MFAFVLSKVSPLRARGGNKKQGKAAMELILLFLESLSKDGRENRSIHRAKPFMHRPSWARTVWQEQSFREAIFSEIQREDPCC